MTGRAEIIGNNAIAVARNNGNVVLNLQTVKDDIGVDRGSEISGAVFDYSFPQYDSTVQQDKKYTVKNAGKVEIYGSPDSKWNVKPFVDNEERGLIFDQKGSHWSTVSLLSGNSATETNPFVVNLDSGSPAENKLQRLNITELAGNNVEFDLRLDGQNGTASGEKNGRDHVVIDEGNGDHQILVNYKGDGSEPESLREAWLVQDNNQQGANFKLKNDGEVVNIGVYNYSLASEVGDNKERPGEQSRYWYLIRTADNPQNPGGTKPEDPGYTPGADTEISFAGSQRYLHWADLQDLRKRLGEVRYGSQDGAWVRGIYQKDLADGEIGTSGMKQTYYGLNFGADRLASVSEERMWLLGASVNLGRAKQKTRDSSNGSGETDRYGVNAYATWAANNGCYADLVLSADYFRQDVTTSANSVVQKGKYNTFGLGASIEVGKQFTFNSKSNTWGPWYQHTWIEPQLQLAYYWLKGTDYKLSNNGLRVKIKDDDSLIGRAGVVIGTKWNYGKNYQDIDKRYVQAHLKGGVKHDFLGNYRVSLNDLIFSKDIGKTTVYYGAGMDWQASKQTRIYVQAEREHGSHYTKEIEISAGIKYQF